MASANDSTARMDENVTIRPAAASDDNAIWAILEPIFRAGETYPMPRDVTRGEALAYWRTAGHEVFVAEAKGRVLGSYYLRANNRGGGAHVANCGYAVAPDASGRGAGVCQACGFETVGRPPGAFRHPRLGYVDALVMVRNL